MTTQRKRYSAEFKARMAFEAWKGENTINELASEYGVHPTQIAQWKKYLQTEGPRLFAARSGKREQADEAVKYNGPHKLDHHPRNCSPRQLSLGRGLWSR